MFEAPFVRSAYNYDRELASDESGLDCQRILDPETGEMQLTPSLAKQSFAEECDINTIVRRFNVTGQLPVNVRMPTYADFLEVPSYQEAMNALREADESFMQMPAEVRARFHNDPAEFVEFCSDDRNRDEAVKLGLVAPAVAAVVAPVKPDPVTPTLPVTPTPAGAPAPS